MSTPDPAATLTEALRQLIAQQLTPSAPQPPAERLLRAETVAARLGCSKAHVYDLWERGTLPCVVLPSATTRTGRAKRIRESDLDAWIAALGQAPAPLQHDARRSGARAVQRDVRR